jgi:ATP-binding cassette, subfamily B, bacterial
MPRSRSTTRSAPSGASFKALAPIVPYAARYKGRIAGALIALTVASAATLAAPLAVRRMIDYGFSRQSSGLIDAYFVGLAGLAAILAIASGSRYFLVTTLGERVVADLRTELFAHLTRLDAAFYDKSKSGELLSRLTADTTQMKSAFGASASVLLRNLFLFVGAVAMMIYSSPMLSAFVLIAIPIIVLPLYGFGRSVRGRSRTAQDELAEASAFAAENLTAMRIMHAFNAEAATVARFRAAVERAYAAARKAIVARSFLTTAAIFLAFGSVVAVLWFGAQDVLAGRMTGGLLSQFVLFAVMAASALGQLSEVWSEIAAAAGAAGRIGEILAAQPSIARPAAPVAMPKPARGEIRFKNVSFEYPGRPGDSVLRELSFQVAPGETVALVGPSGAGKSTVFQLLMRFYDPTAGSVLIDDVDLRLADPAEARARIALVPQEPIIFGASVADNIAYGRPEASADAIRSAAERAGAHSFIVAAPGGYQARVGERGITLSGGQRQRLAVARALLLDAPILLLDEATSALDAESEKLVQAALEEAMGERTTLVIAHRLATVLRADRILVMDGGRIVEEGDHASLVRENGLYARLARLQFETGAAALAESSAPAK